MTITLPLPPSINETYGVNKQSRIYKKTKVVDWETEAGWIVKTRWKKKPLTGKVYLSIWWYLRQERQDISNGLKVLEDLLQKQRVYLNDNQIYMEVIRKEIDPKNPRVEVEISPMLL